MMNSFKGVIDKISQAVYKHLFKEDMPKGVRKFIAQLSIVGIGSIISTGLLAVFSIIGGRLLGPEEFGKFTLIQSTAMLLVIPMFMGYDMALLKYASEKQELKRQRDIISTALFAILIFTIISATVFFIFNKPISELINSKPEITTYSILFALSYVLYHLVLTILRSTEKIKAFAIVQPIQAILLIVLFIIFYYCIERTYISMTTPMVITYVALFGIIVIVYLRTYITKNIKISNFALLTKYAFSFLVAGIATGVYTNIGKIIVSRYMTMTDVGIYGAYFTATISTGAVLWSIFNIVFFPTVSKYENKMYFITRINRAIPLIFITGTLLVLAFSYIVLRFYGGAYTSNFLWLTLFSIASIIKTVLLLYVAVIASKGARGAMFSSIAAIATATVSVIAHFVLVPNFGIMGAAIAMIVGFTVGTVTLLIISRSYIMTHA